MPHIALSAPHRLRCRNAYTPPALPPLPEGGLPPQGLRQSQYQLMETAFRASGGLVDAHEVVDLLLKHTSQPISRLARWIVSREVISLRWQARTMLPMFQFDGVGMQLRAEVAAVMRELAPVMSEWEIGLWFCVPNGLLADLSPLEALAHDAASVHDAARGERYLLRA